MFSVVQADFGVLLPRLSLLATITFAYSVLSPLINVLAFGSKCRPTFWPEIGLNQVTARFRDVFPCVEVPYVPASPLAADSFSNPFNFSPGSGI